MLAPVGLRSASWSRVRHSPPAFSMRARAVRVKRRAATDSLGTSLRRTSSVMVPTTTTVLLSAMALPDLDTWRAMREIETGGRLTLDMYRRRSTTLLKRESVRRARKR